MTGTLRIRRSRGALSGSLLALLGLWGALIPLVGPYFHYAYTPSTAWDFTAGRFWLEQLPGLAVLAGGVVVLVSAHRLIALMGAWLAAAGGAWFAVGPLVAHHWPQLPSAGTPVGGSVRVFLEQVGFFTGLGVLIVLLAGVAMGRLSLVSVSDVRERDGTGTPAAEPRPASAMRILANTPLVRRVARVPEQASDPDSDRVRA
jgi:hypothetical protein